MDLGLAGSLIAFRKLNKIPSYSRSILFTSCRLRLDIFSNQNHRAIIDMSAMRPIVTQREDQHSTIDCDGPVEGVRGDRRV